MHRLKSLNGAKGWVYGLGWWHSIGPGRSQRESSPLRRADGSAKQRGQAALANIPADLSVGDRPSGSPSTPGAKWREQGNNRTCPGASFLCPHCRIRAGMSALASIQ